MAVTGLKYTPFGTRKAFADCPTSGEKEIVEWFTAFANNLQYPVDGGSVNSFFHCCGGREIGGFSRITSTFYDALRNLGERKHENRSYYIDIMNKNVKRENMQLITKAALKKGIQAMLNGITGLSTIVATTTQYAEQALAGQVLRELGFKDVLSKINSNSDNTVTTWIFVGSGKLL